MDFDNRKVYGDTSITDGLVVISQMLNLLFEPKCSPGDWGEYAANFRKAALDR